MRMPMLTMQVYVTQLCAVVLAHSVRLLSQSPLPLRLNGLSCFHDLVVWLSWNATPAHRLLMHCLPRNCSCIGPHRAETAVRMAAKVLRTPHNSGCVRLPHSSLLMRLQRAHARYTSAAALQLVLSPARSSAAVSQLLTCVRRHCRSGISRRGRASLP